MIGAWMLSIAPILFSSGDSTCTSSERRSPSLPVASNALRWRTSRTDFIYKHIFPFFQIMLPNPYHAPTSSAQGCRYFFVALAVSGNLGIPELPVGFGGRVTTRATVPETAVNKHCEFRTWKNEVGFAENFLVTPPTRNFVSSK